MELEVDDEIAGWDEYWHGGAFIRVVDTASMAAPYYLRS